MEKCRSVSFPYLQSMVCVAGLDDSDHMRVFSSETGKDLVCDSVRDTVISRHEQNGGVYRHKHRQDNLCYYSPVPRSNLGSSEADVTARTSNPPDVCLTVPDARESFLCQHPQTQLQEQTQQPTDKGDSSVRLSPGLQGEVSTYKEPLAANCRSYPAVISSSKMSHLLLGDSQQQQKNDSLDYRLSNKQQQKVHQCSTTQTAEGEVGLLQQHQQPHSQRDFIHPKTRIRHGVEASGAGKHITRLKV